MKLTLGLLVGLVSGISHAAELKQLGWLEGHWGSDMGMEEHITSPAAGRILGLAKEVNKENLTFFEFFEIEEQNGVLVLKPQPFGKDGASEFEATEVTGTKVVFENAKNDFPKTITYERSSKTLLSIAVEGEKDGKPLRLLYALSKK